MKAELMYSYLCLPQSQLYHVQRLLHEASLLCDDGSLRSLHRTHSQLHSEPAQDGIVLALERFQALHHRLRVAHNLLLRHLRHPADRLDLLPATSQKLTQF